MSSLRYRFVGAAELPKKLSDEVLAVVSSIEQRHIDAIRGSKFDRRAHLSIALQVVCLAATGAHPASDKALPTALLRSVCRQLGLHETTIATLRSASFSPNALTRHRAFARELLGFREFGAEEETALQSTAEVLARDATGLDHLVQSLYKWLFDHRIVIPWERRVLDIARGAFAQIEALALDAIRRALPSEVLRRILNEMFEESVIPGVSILEWLKIRVGRASPSNLEEVCQRVDYLREMGVDSWDLAAISRPRRQVFAHQVIKRPPSQTSRRTLDTQTVEIVCFLKQTLDDLTDEAITRSIRRSGALLGMGRTKTEKRKAAQGATARARLQNIQTIGHDATRSLAQRVRDMLAEAEQGLADQELTAASVQREVLIEENLRVKGVLSAFQSLDLQAATKSKDAKLLDALIAAQGSNELAVDFDSSIVPPAWRKDVEDPDRIRARKALEACAMESIRSSLQAGRIWVSHSGQFRSYQEMLIPPEEWAASRVGMCKAYGLDEDPEKLLHPLLMQLQIGLSELVEAMEAGLVEIDAEGNVCLPKLSPLDIDDEVRALNDFLLEGAGTTQLSDVLLTIDKEAGFSKVLLGRKARDEHELVCSYGALLALGMGIEAKAVAAMIPGLTAADVTAGMRVLEVPKVLRDANDRVVDFQQRLPIVKEWGLGSRASSDMMALDATHHLGVARRNPRRKTPSTGLYSHVLDTYPVVHYEQILQNTWQAAPAVHGIQRYNANLPEDRVRVDLLAVDTHGYSNVGMAVAKLLRFDLCPHLAHLPERRLLVPRGMEVPQELEAVTQESVNLKAIKDSWDDVLRVMASIASGRATAQWVIERLGAAAKGEGLFNAFDNLGKLLRTIFLCDYFSNPDFRREIRTLLNRGESVHALERHISPTRIHHTRGRRASQMEAIVGAHTLLTNIVLAFQTQLLHQSWERMKAMGPVGNAAMLRHVSPGKFANINFQGILTFTVAPLADVLLDARQAPAQGARRAHR